MGESCRSLLSRGPKASAARCKLQQTCEASRFLAIGGGYKSNDAVKRIMGKT